MYKLLFVALLLTFLVTIALFALQKKDSTVQRSNAEEKPFLNRSQETQLSGTYHQEDMFFENKNSGIMLAGTLTLPKSKQPSSLAILIPGYGKHDRNLTGMGHESFLILADYLTQRGIGVLRFDKRGVGQSTGNYDTATTQDFADDVLAGVDYLKSRTDVDTSQIGLIGISEGGLIASIVAAKSHDVTYAVLMAPAVQKNSDDLIEQTGLQLKADGASEGFVVQDRELRKKLYTIIIDESDYGVAEKKLQNLVTNYLASLSESQKDEAKTLPFAFTDAKKDILIKTFNSPWYHFFLKYDRTASLEQITKPVLVLNGTVDWIATPYKIFPVVSQALQRAGNKDYKMIELPNLNHMFQTAKTGSFAEYATIKQAIAPVVLETITNWVLERTVKNK